MQNTPPLAVEAPPAKPGRSPTVGPIPRWKRVLDVSLILAGLPVVLPLAVLIAAVIKTVSRGGVLFRQVRIGYLGERFVCLKFRTMQENALTDAHERYLKTLMQSDEPMTKMDSKGDSRLIPFGSILRSTGLDELPQLINILRGEMSIVGPRPCLPYEYNRYLPWQKQRLNALPGLTGLWQVSGKNKTTFEQMVKLDISYAERRSLGLDLAIIARTVPAIVIQVVETALRRMRSLSAQ